jgi:ribonuclease-3 family protein
METGVDRQAETYMEEPSRAEDAKDQCADWQYMQELFQMREVDVRVYSPLALAYIGDAVYDLIIRSLVLNEGNRQVQKMHRQTSSMVQASAQAKMASALQERMSGEEHAVYKRGRNARSMSPAKNQSVSDYHKATGFEALIGYLYLKREWKRMLELIKAGLDALESEQ